MSDVLIKNGHLLTMDPKKGSIEKGDIAIDGDRISKIGRNLEEDAEIEIDAQNKAVLPGLVNAHTHLSMVLLRGIADDLTLQTWLREKIWPVEKRMEKDDIYIGALLGCLEMIKTGTTSFADLYFSMDKVAQAVDETGLRASLAYAMIDRGDPDKMEDELKGGKKFVKRYERSADGRISTMFGPHSTYTCSPMCLKQVRKLADEHGVGIHIHLSENEEEIETVLKKTDERPVKFLNSMDFLRSDVLAAHCTHLDKEEIEIIEEKGVKPVHNPISNMKLASGISPVADMLREDIPVALGTDGAASNNSLDMLEEIKFAALLSKVSTGDPTAVPARDALKMATLNGARAIGKDDEIGSLEVGKKADLILIELNKPHLIPRNDVESHVVYSSTGADVDTTIVDGSILMRDGEVLALDEREIMEKASNCAKNLMKRANSKS